MAATQTLSPDDSKSSSRNTFIYPPVAEPVQMREFMKERIFLFSGQYAILCQFAQPSLAKGTFEHSDFGKRMARRLENTTTYLVAAVFGTQEEKEAIFGLIHRFHSRVKGDGYYADDPNLHKWTAATVFVGWVTVHEVFIGEIPPEKLEHLFKEASVFATSLRMPPEMWPSTLEEFWEYWNHNLATLQISNEAKQLCQELLWPVNLPLLMWAGAPLARLVTVHLLPDRLVREYGLEELKQSTQTQYRVAVTFIRVLYRNVPQSVKRAMSERTLNNMRKAAEKIRTNGHW